MDWWLIIDVVLALGVTIRLTRAVTVDAIGGRWLRDPVERWARRGHPETGQRARREFWSDGLVCPFCVSTWVGIGSFATMAATEALESGWLVVWRIVAAGLTASFVVAHVMVALGDVNDDDEAEEYDELKADQATVE